MSASLFDLPAPRVRHPAPYSSELIPVFVRMLRGSTRILDPLGGRGSIFDALASFLPGVHIDGIEIEPEWACQDPRITLGNALYLPWPAATFDAVFTSPVYGNRMSDHHEAKDASRRITYTHCLGRPLHPDNAGRLQWGPTYRDFHVRAWTEARRVLSPGGRFVLNVKDFYRKGVVQPVTAWHIETLTAMGFAVREHVHVNCPGMRFGRNGNTRVDYESVILFELDHAPATTH